MNDAEVEELHKQLTSIVQSLWRVGDPPSFFCMPEPQPVAEQPHWRDCLMPEKKAP